MVPFIRDNMPGRGLSLLAAAVLLGIMILPTIITVAQARSMPFPRNTTRGLWRSVPTTSARCFASSCRCGIRHHGRHRAGRGPCDRRDDGRHHGGRQPTGIPGSIFDGVRTMTANIVLEMGYAADLHRGALVTTGVVLFVFILLITMLFNVIKKRGETK